MTITLNDLCNTLQLTPVYGQEAQLNALKSWCLNNISRDIRYEGREEEQYIQYFSLAATYLDDFIANIPDNLSQKIVELENINAIQYAAENGYDQFISSQTVLPDGVLDEGDTYGMTPLHKSAAEGYVHTVHALLEKGANPKKVNVRKQFPIQSALFVPMLHDNGLIARKEIIFNELLTAAPDVINEHDADGNTVLHIMAAHEFENLVASIVAGNSALALLKNNASLYPVHTAILNQQPGILSLLLGIEGVAELGDSENRVPLHYAARYGTADMVERCCLASGDINVRDGADKTPLLWAAEDGNQEALQILMKHGADATLADYQGFTILHYAIDAGNELMVRWIADNAPAELLKQPDSENHSPLFHAQEINNPDILECLKSKGVLE